MDARGTAQATTLAVPVRVRMTASVMLLALIAALLPGRAGAAELERLIVGARGSLAAATEAVVETGGAVVDRIDTFGMLVVDVPATEIDELTADPATTLVTPDVELSVQSTDDEAARAARETVHAAPSSDAGEGVGVVLVDTGVSDHPDLAGQVTTRFDLTEDADGVDHHGHGTFLAGLVAGSGAASDGAYTGAAPGAHIVSLKVAGADGTTDLSTVLQALVMADTSRDLLDAPVVLLALSGPTGDVPDPLMLALEILWARGSTVVVAAGNNGPEPGSVGSPGADPYLITVGSLDDQGTVTTADDVVADFSSRGPTPWGHAKPELLAPGVAVIGPANPGSTIYENAPQSARIGDDYFRGSGTSMSAALAAGAAAAVIATEPGLEPDAVKGRLLDGAGDLDGTAAGVLDVPGAMASTVDDGNTDLADLPEPVEMSPQDVAKANRHLRQIQRVVTNDNPNDDASLAGLTDALRTTGFSWTGFSWTDEQWAGFSWTDVDWDALDLDGFSWTADPWAGFSWTGFSWTGDDWAGFSWTEEDWSGFSWTGFSWTGFSWTGFSWTGFSWTWDHWAGFSWVDQDWAGFSWTEEDWSGFSWTDGDWSGFSWVGDDWSGFSWAGFSWAGFSWAGFSWAGFSWAAADWG